MADCLHTVAEIRAEMQRLDKIVGVDTSRVGIRISARAIRQYGYCRYRKEFGSYHPIYIAISKFLLQEDEVFWDTVRHEYAHAAVLLQTGRVHHHDEVWKALCKKVGANPTRLAGECKGHSEAYKSAAKYAVVCPSCGKTCEYVRAGNVVKSLMAGRDNYICGLCGSSGLKLKIK